MQKSLLFMFEGETVKFAEIKCNDTYCVPFIPNKEYQLGFLRSKAMEFDGEYIYNIQWNVNYGVDMCVGMIDLINPISSLTTKKAYPSGTPLKSVVHTSKAYENL